LGDCGDAPGAINLAPTPPIITRKDGEPIVMDASYILMLYLLRGVMQQAVPF
jgi:hypothetical protein